MSPTERKSKVQERAKRWVVGWSAAWLCAVPMHVEAKGLQEEASELVWVARASGEEASWGAYVEGGWRVVRRGEVWMFEGAGGGWSASRCGERVCEGVVFDLGERVGVSERVRVVEGGGLEFEGVEMESAHRGERMAMRRAVYAQEAWQRFEGLKQKRIESKKERR